MFRWCISAVLLLSLADVRVSAQDASESELLFVRRVAPLLREKCSGCHGDGDTLEGNFDTRSLETILRGGDSEEAGLIPGKPDESPLLLAVSRTSDTWSAMPPKEAEKLTAEETAWLKRWIETGAAWPAKERQRSIEEEYAKKWSVEDGIPVTTSGGLKPDWTNRKYEPDSLWAYQPLKPPVIAVTDSKRHPIDHLIESRSPEGIQPAPRADRRTLIRRVTYDLTGLPPTPQEVELFVSDPRDDRLVFAELVDRLLESPHYGERMAQHWLDVVRYADSSGFANDFERGNAWRYRDYVVRAFNEDKPFDQFIREQIAGDEIKPDDPEGIIATGFLRMGPWELTGMEVAKVARQRFLDDVTNSVGETFLGHSLQCARCHDHKFDPVPTRDYYSIQSVFATTQLTERSAAFLENENTSGFEERKYLELQRNRHSEALRELDDVLLENAQKWYADQGKSPDAWNAALERIRKNNDGAIFNNVRQALRNAGQKEGEYPPKLVGFTPAEFGLERVSRKGLQRLDWEFDRYKPFALAVYNGRTPQVTNVSSPTRVPANRMQAGELEETCILAGGDPFSPTEPTPPNALSVLNDQLQAEFPTTVEGRRTALADWIANPKNPLTSRVIVNRVWQWHFGRAIAGNPNNFGSTGQRPTHPELLDWLANQFLVDGWSIKSLHRHILNSDAYARSTTHPNVDELAKSSSAATAWLVFQPRRLSAEELRDSMLATSGELNRTMGGIPVRPEINLEVALQPRMVMGTFASAWTPNTLPSQRHRRSLYVLRLRGLVPPLLEVFNSPAPDFSCERRESSTVTPQVFALFNGNNPHTRAIALANRLLAATNSDSEALTECFRLLYSRSPTSEETADVLMFWKDLEVSLPETLEPVESQPLEVVRTAVEENTGEHFSFTETLYSNRDFVPDLQPHEVDRHVRAFADICLVLFNSNEFVYVY